MKHQYNLVQREEEREMFGLIATCRSARMERRTFSCAFKLRQQDRPVSGVLP